MDAIICFGVLCSLLVVGKILRIAIPLLQWLYLPSSIIGGVIGLIIFTLFPQLTKTEVFSAMCLLPGFLINVVFATLFLGLAVPAFKRMSFLALPQLCFGQILAWGQYVIGIGLTMLILIPIFKVSPAFGNLLEIGFEGGHGTVGGMIETFKSFNWSDGIALGYTMATIGMILGVTIGMVLINWAFRKNHITSIRSFKTQTRYEKIGIYHRDSAPIAGKQTVICDSIDSLAWHISLVGIAILIGFGILKFLQYSEVVIVSKYYEPFLFKGFPLFPLCMFGGLIVQKLFSVIKQEQLIDHGQMQRLSGAALDFLVVAALSTISLKIVLNNLVPLLILVIAGAVWNIFLVIYLAPRIFKDAWFERAIAEFGQSMGVTATGLLLLRTVDAENRTVASEAFGYKQLFHEPIMGGGIWTAMALPLVFSKGAPLVFGISAIFLVVWVMIFFIFRRHWMK